MYVCICIILRSNCVPTCFVTSLNFECTWNLLWYCHLWPLSPKNSASCHRMVHSGFLVACMTSTSTPPATRCRFDTLTQVGPLGHLERLFLHMWRQGHGLTRSVFTVTIGFVQIHAGIYWPCFESMQMSDVIRYMEGFWTILHSLHQPVVHTCRGNNAS